MKPYEFDNGGSSARAGQAPPARPRDLGALQPPVWNPHRVLVLQTGIDALSRLTGECQGAFVEELVGCMAHWVVDLPASERFHHRAAFGLLEHSLEVAAKTALDLDHRWRAQGGGSLLDDEGRSIWARVAFGLGLFHDAGKILDIVVQMSEDSPPWDPLAEPLASFKHRFGASVRDRTPWRFRARRGLKRHEGRSTEVMSAILSGPAWTSFRPLLESALEAYRFRHLAGDQVFPVPLEYLAAGVHVADVETSRWGWGGDPGHCRAGFKDE